MDRRTLLKTAAGLGAAISLSRFAPALATPGPEVRGLSDALKALSKSGEPFSRDLLVEFAAKLSRKDYVPPVSVLSRELLDLDYDGYRMIHFNRNKAVWRGDLDNFNLQFFHAGYLYKYPVDVFIVENGEARRVSYEPEMFIWDRKLARPASDSDAGFAGFRVHAPIHRADRLDELAVFQGASYFRSMATGQEYGISARGLAIDTGQPQPEEFPDFRSFWIEKPASRDDVIVAHALLDSPSISGAYTFTISNATTTVMDIEATLFPRKTIPYAGIAPLTSMFRSGPQHKTHFDDFRPRVYDSEALLIWNGAGERLIRPLINPGRVEFSVFLDNNPRGFGLITRNRNFRDYQDLHVRYDLRPSAWVEPIGDWGEGSVDLIEIPTPNEYNDNIVAFWHPKEPLQPGKTYSYKYRLHWCWDPPLRSNVAVVTYTRIAQASKAGWHACHLDIQGPLGFQFCNDFSRICPNKRDNLQISASEPGKIGDIYFEPNPVLGGYRLSFDFLTEGVAQTDLRVSVTSDGRPISEIWTYRWTV